MMSNDVETLDNTVFAYKYEGSPWSPWYQKANGI